MLRPWSWKQMERFCLAGAILFVLALTIGSSATMAAPLVQDPGGGETIFTAKCAACHTIGGGILVGPDLIGVTEKQTPEWLANWIKQPDLVLAAGDPIATQMLAEFNNIPMPNMGLTDAEVQSVIAYIAAQSAQVAGGAAPAPAPVPALPAGKPEDGRKLFTGEYSLVNGGPACMSCHNVSGVGQLGGGTLGPDLTHVLSRYGEAGLAASLQSLPFPSMQGVFTDAPLTLAEQGALLSFFSQADQTSAQSPAPSANLFVWFGLGGFAVLLALTPLIWRDRFSGVLKPLLGGAK